MLLIIVILILVFGVGGFGWHQSGYAGGPYLGGGVGLILLIVVLFFLFGGGGRFGW